MFKPDENGHFWVGHNISQLLACCFSICHCPLATVSPVSGAVVVGQLEPSIHNNSRSVSFDLANYHMRAVLDRVQQVSGKRRLLFNKTFV